MGINDFEPTEDDVRVWIEMADSNHDGSVSLEEYENVILTSLKNSGIKIEDTAMVL